MRILVIGGGGREHAIAWKLSQDPSLERVYLAPGNPGMAMDLKLECTGIPSGDFDAILELVKIKKIEFVVVGPDQALADGAVDFLEANGIPAFGPVKEAAKVEWSKAFSKNLMREANIPTAKYEVFENAVAARAFLSKVEWGNGWVIKADGLALGKGVVVCEQRELALLTVEEFLSGKSMGGDAGRTVVVEERLLGREVSAFYLCDGTDAAPLGMACDYKRIGDGETGPNTGGMGAFSPADWLEADFSAQVQKIVVAPLLASMAARGSAVKGVLFVGLMVTPSGPKVIEFNARFGDPETQVLLPLLDEELLPWLSASRNGSISKMPASGPKLKALHGVHVVLAAAGYPGGSGVKISRGDRIEIEPELLSQENSWEDSQIKVFFAGVASEGGKLTTSGGRVLGITALGATRLEARERAYSGVSRIKFAGAQRRQDVGL